MAIWMSSNRLGSERTIATEMAKTKSAPYFPPGTVTEIPGTNTTLLYHADTLNQESWNSVTQLFSGVTVDTGNKKFGTGSFAFNGTSSYFKVDLKDNLNPTKEDTFMFDCWIYNTDRSKNIFSANPNRLTMLNWSDGPSDGTPMIGFGPDENGYLGFYYYNGGATTNYRVTTATNQIPLNTWTHIAFVVENNNNLKLYVDGTRIYDAPLATNGINASTILTRDIYFGGVGATYWAGNIDEIRVLTNSLEVWSAATETVPATPYIPSSTTVDADTKLLMHLENTSDSSSIGSTFTTTGTMTHSAGNFDDAIDTGSGYLTQDVYSSTQNIFSNTYWQLDYWVYNTNRTNNTVNNEGNYPTCILGSLQSGGSGGMDWMSGIDGNGYARFVLWLGSQYQFHVSSSFAANLSGWSHLAFSSDDTNTLRMFVDGNKVYESAHSTKATPAAVGMTIGDFLGTSFSGKIDEVRIISGSSDPGIWTADFIPPQAPWTIV